MRALESGEPAILMTPGINEDSPLYRVVAVAEAQGRAVTIGSQLTGNTTPAVMANDERGIRLIMEHLRGVGHEAIGFITLNPQQSIERIRIATWKACCNPALTPAQIERRLFVLPDLKPQRGISRPHLIHRAICAQLARPELDMTALICSGDTTTLATLAACQANGYDVPSKMSVVAIGDSPIMEFYNPPVTCVDVDLARHVETAFQIIEAAIEGVPPAPELRLIEPTLIERKTVASPRSTGLTK